jgi:hypothetical protein
MKTERLPAAAFFETRDATLASDALMYNFYKEQHPGGVRIVKRPGYLRFCTNWNSLSGEGLGLWYYSGGIIYINGATLLTPAQGHLTIPNAVLGDPYQFVTIPAFGATPTKVFFKNTHCAYVYDGAAITQVTDSNYPATTVYGVVYLDGAVYVMAVDGTINGSNIADPLTWNSLNFIAAKSKGDVAVALVRHLNYIVALKDESTEFFYDASASVTSGVGSNLAPLTTAYQELGSIGPMAIAYSDNTVYYISKSVNQGRAVQMFSGVESKEISTPFIARLLAKDDLSDMYGWTAKFNGHEFYVLVLLGINITLVWNKEANDWSVWDHSTENVAVTGTGAAASYGWSIITPPQGVGGPDDGSPVKLVGDQGNLVVPAHLEPTDPQDGTFRVFYLDTITGAITYYLYIRGTFPMGFQATDGVLTYVLSYSDGQLFSMGPAYSNDDGTPIDARMRSMIHDGGGMVQKTYRRFEVACDVPQPGDPGD